MSEHYFISTGQQTKMFTLRSTCTYETWVCGVCYYTPSSYYIKNLANDYKRTVEKAQKIALNDNVLLKLDENVNENLNEIRHRDHEIVLKERIEKAENEVHHHDCWVSGITKFSNGKYCGKSIREVIDIDRQYIKWVAKRNEDDIQSMFATQLLKNNPDMTPESEYYGNIKDKIETSIKITFKKVIETFYGTSIMLKMIDEQGCIFITFYSGNKKEIWELENDDVVKIKATIKKHDEYNNVKETYLTRMSII